MLQRMVVWLGRRAAGRQQPLKQSKSVRKLTFDRQASSSADNGEVQRAREAAFAKHQQPTIFSKILSKEIPADIIHEDEMVKHLFQPHSLMLNQKNNLIP